MALQMMNKFSMYYPNKPIYWRNVDYTKISDLLLTSFFERTSPVKTSANENTSRVAMSKSSKTHPGHFKILYFASASSHTSKDTEELAAPLPLSMLFDTLEEKYAGFKSKVLESCLVTVNLEYVDIPDNGESAITIKEGDEVAIIPPVSSG